MKFFELFEKFPSWRPMRPLPISTPSREVIVHHFHPFRRREAQQKRKSPAAWVFPGSNRDLFTGVVTHLNNIHLTPKPPASPAVSRSVSLKWLGPQAMVCKSMEASCPWWVGCPWYLVTIGWVWPPPSNSDHQDYYIFSRGSL